LRVSLPQESRDGLDPSARILVEISAALSARDGEAVEEALRAAVDRRLDPVAVEETILQSYLFLGYPAALNGFGRWRAISGRPPAEPTVDDPALWEDRGERVCGTVYGHRYPSLRENIRKLHPDMERWMVLEGYGKVLGRPGLPLVTREYCIVAILAVQGVERQLHSHLRGALHAGGDAAALGSVLEIAARFQEHEAARWTVGLKDEVLRRWAVASSGDPSGAPRDGPDRGGGASVAPSGGNP
jgi:4-carboxymuconolactone decarboxylase